MNVTRDQVNAAKEALGLDQHLTHSITITPSHVHAQVIVLEDGQPLIQDGTVGMRELLAEITEPEPEPESEPEPDPA